MILQEADGGAGGVGCGRRREHSSSAKQRDALEQRGEPAAPRAAHRRSGPHCIRSGRALLRFLRFVECCSCFVLIFCMCSLYSYVLRVCTVLYIHYVHFSALGAAERRLSNVPRTLLRPPSFSSSFLFYFFFLFLLCLFVCVSSLCSARSSFHAIKNPFLSHAFDCQCYGHIGRRAEQSRGGHFARPRARVRYDRPLNEQYCSVVATEVNMYEYCTCSSLTDYLTRRRRLTQTRTLCLLLLLITSLLLCIAAADSSSEALRHILGSTAVGDEYGGVSCVCFNRDFTRLLCGHARGQVPLRTCSSAWLLLDELPLLCFT